jgi:hypothetical protein
LDYPAEALPAELVLSDFTSGALAAEYLQDEGEEKLIEKTIDFLENVNKKLEGSPFKIAYRVRDEFLIYVAAKKMYADKVSGEWIEETFDVLLNMKILPRIEGDEERTKEVLTGLQDLMEEYKYKTSTDKIKEMLTRLEKYQYTSYWP